MAALQKIRSSLVAQLAIGLGMVAFIVTGFVTCSRGSQQQETVVTELNGEELNNLAFDEMVEEYEVIMRIMRNDLTYKFSSEEEAQIREQVWQMFVANNLLEKECNELGLTVTDNELAKVIKEGTHPMLTQLPLFVNPQTNAFDFASLQQFLKQYNDLKNNANVSQEQVAQMQILHTAWIFVEKQLRTAILREKYQSLLSNLTFSNPISAKAGFEAQAQETDIVMAALPYSTLDDSKYSKVEDADLKAKLAEYQEGYCFDQTTGQRVNFYNIFESRDLKYIDVTVVPSDADKKELNDAMDSYAAALQVEGANIDSVVSNAKSLLPYTAIPMSKNTVMRMDAEAARGLDSMAVGTQTAPYLNLADNTMNIARLINKVSRPDSIEIRELAVVNADLEAAKATADSIINVLKAGEPFDSVAKRMDQTGIKHWITGQQFEGASLDAKTREYIDLITTTPASEYYTQEMPDPYSNQNYIRVGQVTDRKAIETKYDIAIIKRSVDFSQETFKKYMNDLETFVNNCKDVEEVEKKSAKAGYIVQNENVQKGTHTLARVAGTREIVRWAFNRDTEVGNVFDAKAFGTKNDHLVVAFLTRINPAGKANLENEQVKETVANLVKNDKKAEDLKKQMEGKSLAQIAKMNGAVTDTIQHITFANPARIMKMTAQEAAVSGAASALAANKTATGVRGNAGVYAIQVLKKNTIESKFDEKAEMQRNAMQNASIVNEMFNMNADDFNSIFFPVLKNAKMVDNRNIFF